MNSKTDEGSPTQPPKPRKGYYEGEKADRTLSDKAGGTQSQFTEIVYQAVSEALAKHRNQQSAPL